MISEAYNGDLNNINLNNSILLCVDDVLIRASDTYIQKQIKEGLEDIL
jgi:hypothetical protein